MVLEIVYVMPDFCRILELETAGRVFLLFKPAFDVN